jgi:hypothetical protein
MHAYSCSVVVPLEYIPAPAKLYPEYVLLTRQPCQGRSVAAREPRIYAVTNLGRF